LVATETAPGWVSVSAPVIDTLLEKLAGVAIAEKKLATVILLFALLLANTMLSVLAVVVTAVNSLIF
jgi:hypothetical protein